MKYINPVTFIIAFHAWLITSQCLLTMGYTCTAFKPIQACSLVSVQENTRCRGSSSRSSYAKHDLINQGTEFIPSVISHRRAAVRHQPSYGVNHGNLVKVPIERPERTVSSFSVISLNARSVRNKTSSIQDFVNTKKVPCIAFTETWLRSGKDKAIIQALKPEGYNLVSIPRESEHYGGGVGLLLDSEFKSSVKGSTTDSGYSQFEHVRCEIRGKDS